MSNVRDPDVDHVIWTSVSVRALNPKDRVEAFYFGAYACCWEKPVDRRGLAAAFQGVAKTNIFAEYSVRTYIYIYRQKSIHLSFYFRRLRLLLSKHVHLVIAYLSKQAVALLHMVTFYKHCSHHPILT